MNPLLDAALAYAARGWAVFPVEPGGKRPIGALAPQGCHSATTSEVVIRAWWASQPDANIGVATGEKSGLLVVDVDPDAGGDETMTDLLIEHGNPSEDVLFSQTGGGGEHIWFAYPRAGRYGNTAGRVGKGVDTRGEGGYVVAPPSVTEHPYVWLNGPLGQTAPLADPPQWLLDLLTDKPVERPTRAPAPPVSDRYAAKALEDELTAVALAQPGGRNDTLNRAAFNLGTLVGAGLLELGGVRRALVNAARSSGLPEPEAFATVESGLHAGLREPRQVENRRSERTFQSAPAASKGAEFGQEAAWQGLDGSVDTAPQESAHSASTEQPFSPADDLVSLAEALGGYLDAAEAVKQGRVMVVPTGLHDLDHLTGGGFRGGELVVLAARPGMGKSAMATTIARHAAGTGVGVLLVSAEMSAEQVAGRLLAAEARVDAQRLRTGAVDAAEWARVEDAFARLGALPIWLADRSSPALASVVAVAERAIVEKGVGLVVVDYVGLVEVPGRDDRRIKVGQISRALKALARDRDVPVLALSQLNRDSEKREDHKPRSSDLRESGDLEQDADIVLLLSREEAFNPDTDRRGIADLTIAKSRSGPTGAITLRWSPEQVTFSTLESYRAYPNDGGSF